MAQPALNQAPGMPAPDASSKPSRARRPRRPSPPRPAFFIVQVLDEQGQPMAFDKKRIKVVSVERSAEKVLEIVEGGNQPHVFFFPFKIEDIAQQQLMECFAGFNEKIFFCCGCGWGNYYPPVFLMKMGFYFLYGCVKTF